MKFMPKEEQGKMRNNNPTAACATIGLPFNNPLLLSIA
jgi:hypothetical protein